MHLLIFLEVLFLIICDWFICECICIIFIFFVIYVCDIHLLYNVFLWLSGRALR